MNQATQDMKDNLLGSPVSATVMGAGRVQAFDSATAVSVADPGACRSDSRRPMTEEVRSFMIRNLDSTAHRYR